MGYTVFVDDNFHFADESERYTQGEYDTYEEALAEAKRIVEMSLQEGCHDGVTADELYKYYMARGDDPYIIPSDDHFSAWEYAKQRCAEICK